MLTPWRPFGSALEVDTALNPRLIHTVSRVEDVADLLGASRRPVRARAADQHDAPRTARELWTAAERAYRARLEGVALHLPLAQGSHLSEVQRRGRGRVVGLTTGSATSPPPSSTSSKDVRRRHPPRIGTGLWGDREALRVTSTVLDAHAVERGDCSATARGPRPRAPPRGHRGTAHGIGLEAPTGESSIRARAATLARGGLDAVGFVRSPFSIGKQRLFAEPPHMQASMLFLPQGARVPAVGDPVDVRVRYTATAFDRVVIA